MTQILEILMLICFGISWPVSVIKSLKSKTTNGKSLIFLIAIIIGYLCGISAKIAGGQINYVIALYVINLMFVSFDTVLYFINKKHSKKGEAL